MRPIFFCMPTPKPSSASKNKMRIWHRYLGFFLAGIMAVYALSGVILIFRNTSFLKKDIAIDKTVATGLSAEALGKEIKVRNLRFTRDSLDLQVFNEGIYNPATGQVQYQQQEYPYFISQLTRLHKANANDPLFYLNVFFGVSLLFFVLSSFWMFRPRSSIFRQGMYWTAGGILLTLLMLFYK